MSLLAVGAHGADNEPRLKKNKTFTVRHPRQSRWLDEWDRLKGGRFLLQG
jgi:hypothetical protein